MQGPFYFEINSIISKIKIGDNMSYEGVANKRKRKPKKKRKWYVTIFKVLFSIVSVILIFGIVILSFFTVVEYRPRPLEEVEIKLNQTNKITIGDEYQALTFNIGYGALGKDEDFVMDGGKKGVPDSKEVVVGYLNGIKGILDDNPSDIYLLQEVDLKSRRSYKIDQAELFSNHLGASFNHSFAYNYKALFVPFPFSFTNYMGRVESGIQTLSSFSSNNAERHQFPGAFSWPVRTVNLKRGMLVNYLPIEGSDKLLVLVNLHMSAYDTGTLREQEMKYLKDFMTAEYNKGNYVLVGGDFNQTFPSVTDAIQENDYFTPIKIEEGYLGDNFMFAVDPNVYTSRLLNQPYNPTDTENTYHFIIDGFIVSKNIEIIEVLGLNLGFVHSDHNPVKLRFKLN